MFSRNMSALMMAAGFVFAGAASAATTAPVGNGSDYPAYPAAHSTLTRADVQAQFVEAQKNGTLLFKGDQLQANAFEKGSSNLSRAEVVKAAHDARVAGTLPEGESFGE